MIPPSSTLATSWWTLERSTTSQRSVSIITSAGLPRFLVTDFKRSSRQLGLYTSEFCPPYIKDISIYNTDISRHFGLDVIANKTGLPVKDSKVTTLWLKLYKVPPFYFLCYCDDIPSPSRNLSKPLTQLTTEFLSTLLISSHSIVAAPTSLAALGRLIPHGTSLPILKPLMHVTPSV